jgi:ornithine cyclodeaminase/alanine dehydrogenase-like protein (mu-crystallin family)
VNPPLRLVDAAATREALPFDALVAALRGAFADAGGITVPARHVHTLAGHGTTSLLMPAWDGAHYGVKVVNVAPNNAARGLPGVHGSYLLHDAATGVPLALIDGSELTTRRTAAASALAADHLARADASHLLVVGAGRIAAVLPAAYRAVRRIERVTVWAREPSKAQALAGQLAAQGFAADVAEQLDDAVARADIVSCATLADEPLVRGARLGAGSHLDLIGSFTPTMREADDDCFRDAGLWVDTDEALAKSGDLLGPMARGVFAAADVRGTLAGLCDGRARGRTGDAERTVFKSVGTALEDLAAAKLVLRRN